MIGVQDSGVGGTSVLAALQARMPGESFVYVADSGHAPYGDRDTAHVVQRSLAIARHLVGQGAKALVVACNTATVAAKLALREAFPGLPVVGIEPAIKPAVAASRSGTVLVLATRRTVESGDVAALIERHAGPVKVLLQACPGLVDRIEAGELDSPALNALLERYLEPGLAAGADTIVLGCTHYPFLAPAIARLAGPGVQLLDPAPAVAAQLERVLRAGPGVDDAGPGRLQFLSTGDVGRMQAFLDRTWAGPPAAGRVQALAG